MTQPDNLDTEKQMYCPNCGIALNMRGERIDYDQAHKGIHLLCLKCKTDTLIITRGMSFGAKPLSKMFGKVNNG